MISRVLCVLILSTLMACSGASGKAGNYGTAAGDFFNDLREPVIIGDAQRGAQDLHCLKPYVCVGDQVIPTDDGRNGDNTKLAFRYLNRRNGTSYDALNFNSDDIISKRLKVCTQSAPISTGCPGHDD